MPRGTALSEMVAMFKAECGIELDTSISTAEDARIKRLLSNTQKWLCGQHLFLLGKTSKDIQLAAGTRHYNFPTTDLDIDRLEKRAVVKLGAGRSATAI